MIKKNQGQALVTLLIFVTIMITVVGAAVSVIISNIQSASKFEGGQYAINLAETGTEEAIVRLLRDPNYLSVPGSFADLTVGVDTVRITITTSGNNRTITSRVTSGNYKRAVQVQGTFVNDVFTIASWQEIN